MAPDQQAFEDDLCAVPYALGEMEGHWGRVSVETAAWPSTIFWVRAAARPNAPDRYYFRLLCDGYPAQGPTAAFWNVESNTFLEHQRFPRGTGQVQAVFRTDWNSGQALYHPMDRVAAQGHSDWNTQHQGSLWHSKRTVADFLEVMYGLLNSTSYTGLN